MKVFTIILLKGLLKVFRNAVKKPFRRFSNNPFKILLKRFSFRFSVNPF
jgi:hypothetical protein